VSKQRRIAAAGASKVSLQGERLSERPLFKVVLQIVILEPFLFTFKFSQK
jgi:hypothetical protein